MANAYLKPKVECSANGCSTEAWGENPRFRSIWHFAIAVDFGDLFAGLLTSAILLLSSIHRDAEWSSRVEAIDNLTPHSR